MKYLKALIIIPLSIATVISLVFSQPKTSSWDDYVLYNTKSKHLIHNFKITEKNNILEKGKIYRYYNDYGIFESMYIHGSEARIVYSTEPSGMVNADISNKEIHVYPKKSEKVLYLFIMRTMAKALESGTQQVTVRDINLKLEKQKDKKEGDRVYSFYKVTTNPKIVTGDIVCVDDIIIIQLDLQIYIRNARSFEFEDMFLLPEHFQYDKINLSYTTDEYDYPGSEIFYYKKDINKLLNDKNYERIEY
jgi:hypothetical protein